MCVLVTSFLYLELNKSRDDDVRWGWVQRQEEGRANVWGEARIPFRKRLLPQHPIAYDYPLVSVPIRSPWEANLLLKLHESLCS